jgi:Ca-activated chloride channel family protein
MKNITVNTKFDRNKILASENPDRYLLVDLESATQQSSNDLPLNVALVIDASGSMEGQWIEAAKQAAVEIVQALGDRDRVSVVSFSSDVQVHSDGIVCTNSGKLEAIGRIRELQTRAATDLGAGLLSGAESAARVMAQTATPLTSRVVILSDGMANQGIEDPRQLGEQASQLLYRGVMSSCIGIGPHYSSTQLEAIATHGGGSLHHASRPNEISEIVVAELRSMRSLVAQGLQLEISADSGVEIECLSEYPETHTGLFSSWSEKKTFNVGSFVSGVSRDAIFKVTCKQPVNPGVIVVKVTAKWESPDGKTSDNSNSAEATLSIVRPFGSLMPELDQRVGERVARVWLAHSVRKAIELNTAGQYNEAVAQLKSERPAFVAYCDSLNVGSILVDEWDQAMVKTGSFVNPMMAKEMAFEYLRSSRSYADVRANKYAGNWSEVK